jgi:hypothetical protein
MLNVANAFNKHLKLDRISKKMKTEIVLPCMKQKGITDASMQVRESRYCQGHGQYSKKSYRSNLTVGKEDKKGRCKRSEQVRVKSREKERGR